MALGRRVRLLLGPDRYERLKRAAMQSGSSVAAVIREAIDRLLPASGIDLSAAGALLLEAPSMEVDDWEQMKRAMLDEMSQ